MYDLHKQGIPIITPINQKQVVAALTNKSKLSKSLYDSLGESVVKLNHNIQRNLSRGLAQGSSYADITRNIAREMVGDYSRFNGGALYFANRITRTEGHRIQNQAALDAQHEAKDKGADIVKQWDATLDDRTRPDHALADGQIREIDEPFIVGGEQLDAPGIGGSAEQVINCRCACLQRARWALDEDELKTLEDRANYFGLDKTNEFEDFKEKYLQAVENGGENVNPDLKSKIDAIKEDIENNGGTITEEHLQEAGKAFREEMEDTLKDKEEEMNSIYQKYQEAQEKADKEYETLREELDKLQEMQLGGEEFDPFKALMGEYDNNPEIEAKIEALQDKIMHVYDYSNGLADDFYVARKEFQDLEKTIVSDTLSGIREVGSGDLNLSSHLLGGSSMKKTVENAYEYYPRDWIEKSMQRGTLTPKKVQRGYYSDWQGIIAISDYRDDGGLQTATHELGHRMEKAIPGILEAEQNFFKRRTAGEELQKLSDITGNSAYKANEKAYKDKFLNPYMGKDYGGYAYELVSMGFEWAFNEPQTLLKDKDMADWVFGLLSLY